MNVGRRISEGVKRQVRQECCFGCIICGAPFFQYHHMEKWSKVKTHEPHNIALLCPNHHAGVGSVVSDKTVLELRRTPFNKEKQFTSGLQLQSSRNIGLKLGSNSCSIIFPNGSGNSNVIQNGPYHFLNIEAIEGLFLVCATLTDLNGNPILFVVDGEITASTEQWDYTYEGGRMTIRSGPGKILFKGMLTSDRFEVEKGAFLDQFKDGFTVNGASLAVMVEGEELGVYEGAHKEASYLGHGWGLLHKKRYPDLPPLRGFAFAWDT